MKYTEKILLFFVLTLLCGIGFSSCTVDEPIIVTPKTLDQYVTKYGTAVKAEIKFVDTCKVGYNKNNFTVVSTSSFATYRANYLAALRADSAIIFSPTVTIAQIIAGNYTLATPGKLFRAKINITDVRELNDSIVAATNFVNAAVVGTSAGNVFQADKTIFSNAIANAILTRDALTTIDRQVKTAISSLTTAKTAFKATILPADFTTYLNNSTAYISAQLAIVNNSVNGYNINEYLPSNRNNYLTVLQTSQATVQTIGVTYSQVATAMNNLVSPKAAFIPNVADKRDLRVAITADSLLNTRLTVGSAEGQISLAVQTNLKAYIATGVSTRDNPSASDGVTRAARYSLEVYRDATIASATLNLAIVNATALNASITVGSASGQVVLGAKNTFTTAITTATTVRDAKTSTATQMADALAILTKAQTDFINLKNK